jgi:guanosine-3',5'-bis(diphosphate) 3'-pyrophosphohydrolase
LRDLNREGFAADVIEAVEALTKRPSETRVDAAHRAATNPLARSVKLADIADNMNLNRIAEPSERDIARLAEYEQVQQILLAAQKPN